MTSIVVTGHRPQKLGGYNYNSAKNRAISLAFSRIMSAIYAKHPDAKVITGMALGFDTIVAKECIAAKKPFLAYIPFAGQENKWPAEAQIQYREILSMAEDVNTVTVFDTPLSECKYWEVAKALADRNTAMIESPGVRAAICCWDGEEKGGTFDAIKKIKSMDIPFCVIDPNNVEKSINGRIEWRNQKVPKQR